MRLGKVYLVGAGPGDPDLLTIKARDLIAAAGCVVYDHLVNPEILRHAAPDAELIYAGKRAGKCAMRQETINALLVTKATEHAVVARLKGGDPFIFGRGGEEALALVSAGVPWEVVPGVSAGAAVAAYAGIPITHRGLGSSVAFVTGHEDPAKTESSVDWGRLALGVDTLVIFMGVGGAPEIAERLMAQGRGGETPAAVIRWGTYGHQECHVTSLAELARLIESRGVTAPAIIVIGEVVRLREKLNWFGSAKNQVPARLPFPAKSLPGVR
ncbi:MAG TPA: uroporphyrinogen-III C-methyltransferase [Blastocatellia bacterium]|jgi:uroporphyrinogen III methyltransferase/synthase|nr:uroporphyrinogen-III C-methyltransferase [Blastocatellia bacterium]